ncbi:MAG: COX15/CtaA family protein [Thaumarchaeota archaeon]|nr:COX15/CtaA family protein [Nitrososphaerota archaeon]MCY3976448.1 COX15/CtaA family protein [Nitrososphaerota archaeon]
MLIKYLSLFSLIVLYSLMFIGGYVSAAGLGLTCPDWPLCPNGIFPNSEYFIEWVHRLIAAITGALIISTTISCWIIKNSSNKIKFTGTVSTILVITQITLGAIVIDLKLQALLVAIHLGIGIILFAMVLLTTIFAFGLNKIKVPPNA